MTNAIDARYRSKFRQDVRSGIFGAQKTTKQTRTHSFHVARFFFNGTATTEIYTLSLHDALPISYVELALVPLGIGVEGRVVAAFGRLHLAHHPLGGLDADALEERPARGAPGIGVEAQQPRSEEHTSELQSQSKLVCRLLLEKKKP